MMRLMIQQRACPVLAVRTNGRRLRGACTVRATVAKTPSSATGSDLLEQLQQHTVTLSDSALSVLKAPQEVESSAALVSFSLLSHVLANPSAFYEAANTIEKAIACAHAESPGDEAAALDQALANVALYLKDAVKGRLTLEVDPRLADDADALVARTKALAARVVEQGVVQDRLLFQLPATWAGIQAVQQLEAAGLQCQVTHVYSFAQAVAAVKAGASTLLVNITHVNLWYDRHPGAIRDPQAPRQDAGGDSSGINVGARAAAAMYMYAQQQGGRTKIIAAGLRTPEEAIALSGVDYMVLPGKIEAKLQKQSTLQGYNDGLSATADDSDASGVPVLSREAVAAKEFKPHDVADVDEAHFESELGMAGLELLKSKVADDVEAASKVAGLMDHLAIARE